MTARVHRESGVLRRLIAAGLCCTIWLSSAWGQSPTIKPVKPQARMFWRPYLAPDVPPIRLNNSGWMKDLIRAGNLYLTVQDAIAMVLENNIDIEVARYDPIAAVWQIQRAEAGESLPLSLNPSSLVGSAAPGQGVAGIETSAGVSSTQNGNTAVSRSANVTISPVGSVVQSYDPVFQEASVLSHTSLPEFDTLVSFAPVLVSSAHASTGSLQEGFLSGGSIAVTYSDHYLNENARSDLLNPSVAPSLSLSFSHNLLRGFGVAVNARNITVAKINQGISDLNFKLRLINAVAQTLQLYYGLVAEYEDVKAKQSSLELAQALYEDNKRQLEVGALTTLDVTTAEAQVAADQRDLLTSQSALLLQEIQLKNLLSRTGSADPVLRDVGIVPMDRIVIPPHDDLPPIETMVQQALTNRADLAIEKAQIEAAEVSALGTKNGILPALQVFGSEADTGLAGTRRTITVGKTTETTNGFFAGGTGTALGDVFRRDFPVDRAGASLHATVFNRQAQADYGADQLTIRQEQLTNQKDINQVQVDLMKSIMMLQQARGRYEAAVKYRILEKQLLDSEQEAYSVGKSTSYNVMQMQRGLAGAEDAEVGAMAAWISAVIQLDETRGITLETNHVSIAEAKAGQVTRSTTPRQN
jgi:outer membrane protein